MTEKRTEQEKHWRAVANLELKLHEVMDEQHDAMKKGALLNAKAIDAGQIGQVIEVAQQIPAILDFIQKILDFFKKRPKPPVPVPVPEPPPTPVPTPTPTPTPVPTPEPFPPPTPQPGCAKPASVKLGFRDQRGLSRGFRIMFDASDLDADGNKIPEGCGDYLNETYGQIEAYQKGPGFDHDPVERSSSNPSLLVIATNYEGDWDGNRYKLAGSYEVGVSRAHLKVWRVQRFTIDERGEAHGMGTNAQAIDLPKG